MFLSLLFIHLVNTQIITLNENNIEQYLDKYENLIVTITSPFNTTDINPWLQALNQSSHILLSQDSPIIAAQVSMNNTKLIDILKTYNIFEKNVPTVKFFIQKNYIECDLFSNYLFQNQTPSTMQIATWVMLRVPIYVLRLISQEEVDAFLNYNDVSIVFIGQNNSEYYKTFQNLRQYDTEIKAASCFLCQQKGQESLILSLNKHRSTLMAPFDLKQFYRFLDDNAWPKVMEYSMRAHERVIHLGLPALVLFISNLDTNYKQTMDTFVGLGNRTDNMFFMYIVKERVGRDWQRLVQYVGVTKIPGVQILDLQDKFAHFEMQGEITEENISRFIKEFQLKGVKNVGESLLQNPEVRFNPYAKKSDRFH